MNIRIRFNLAILIVILALLTQGAEAAEFTLQPIDIAKVFNSSAPEINLEEMIQECPNFVSYPGYDGIIWLKRHTYQIDTSGSMSVTTAWVILGRIGIEEKWLDWTVQIPKEGDAQIFEASLYDPGSLTLTESVEPRREGDKWRVNFLYPPEEFIMVLTYRQTYTGTLAIQGMLWLNETLPVWEQTVIAKVDSGRDFEYVTNVNMEPEISVEENSDIYEWMIVNQTPSMSRSLRTESQAWLAFGNKQPLSSLVKLFEDYALMPVPNPPSNVEAWLKKGDLASFFNWLRECETDNSAHIRDVIPENAPWSSWEKSIIACSWINRFNNGACRLFWRLAVDPFQNGFANRSIILSPAIEMKRRNEVFFYDTQQPYEPGVTSLSLIGEALYAPAAVNDLEKRVIPPRGASDNRLSAVYTLNLAEDNTITGSVSLTIRNSWKDFLLNGTDINDILSEVIGKTASENDITAKDVKGGIEISAPLRPSTIILGTLGGNAIIPLSPPQPDWLKDLYAAMIPYSIKFPMTIDMNYKINLHSNVKDVLPPPQVERDNGNKIKYSEKYEYFRRSGRFDATIRLTLSTTNMDQGMEQDMAFALGRFGMQRSIPLKMK